MSRASELERRLAILSPAKRALLEHPLDAAVLPVLTLTPICRRAHPEEPAPLSSGQQVLWMAAQAAPESAAYNVPRIFRIDGALDQAALRRALDALVARHDILRTVFEQQPNGPVQIVRTRAEVELLTLEAPGASDNERLAAAVVMARSRAREPFDLSRDLLLRGSVIRVAPEISVLVLVTHHIGSDGWSKGVFYRELAELYRAYRHGSEPRLETLPLQYADYAVWERTQLDEGQLKNELTYWREQLVAATPLDLPSDQPVGADDGVGHCQRMLPPSVLEAVKTLAQQSGVTVYMVLLAAYQTVLARYTGQEDIIVGSPVAGRTRAELEGLIGYFANPLPLRTNLGGDPTFEELLARVKVTCLDAFEHQELPFESLALELQAESRTRLAELVAVTFTMQNNDPAVFALDGLRLAHVAAGAGAAKLDLVLVATEQVAGLRLYLEYRSSRFSAESSRRMLDAIVLVLTAAAADPSRRLSALPVMTAVEERLILETWNDTAAPFPDASCVHQLFETQARTSPEAVAVAVIGTDGQLTYAELDARADRLAAQLRACGAAPDVPIGIFLERSTELVVALLAVLKSGGAYLPIDPGYPPARVAFMLEDSHAPLVITQARLAERLPAGPWRTFCLDAGGPALEEPSSSPPPPTPDDLAYIIYTSGSTGAPKGVMITHRGVVNYLTWCAQAYDAGTGWGAPVHSSIAFDLTVTALFAPLISGGAVRLIPDALGPEGLASVLGERGGYSLVKITPAHLDLLKDQLTPAAARCATRRFVIGGEQLDAEVLAFWRRMAPDTILINEYGPTETVVGCCTYQVRPADPQSGPIPIGRPIANTRLYVLDRQMSPCPVGVGGELYIGGVGVARGYLNRPELTAERFVRDPWGSAGGRLYRTGDRARWRADGVLEYLGRLDFQVKVRGHRVELGEIENVIARHPHVAACVVDLYDTGAGPALVAYIVADSAAGPAAADAIRDFARASLPDYMVPSNVIRLDALPLTLNGKVDRKALPAPSRRAGSKIRPRNAVEAVVARVWREILRIDDIGATSDFFAVGGHSLLAMRVLTRLATLLQSQVPLRTFFERPTVTDLAEALVLHESTPGRTARVAAVVERVEQMSLEDIRGELAAPATGNTEAANDG